MKKGLKENCLYYLILIQTVILIIGVICLLLPRKTIELSGKDFLAAAGMYEEDGDYVWITNNMGWDATHMASNPLTLNAGVYEVTLDYDSVANRMNLVKVTEDVENYGELKTNPIALDAGADSITYKFCLMGKNNGIRLIVDWCGTDYLCVRKATIKHTNIFSRLFVFSWIILSLIIDVCFYLRKKDYFTNERNEIIVFLLGCLLISAIPLMTNYLTSSGDTGYHMLRIEGLKQGISDGQFPVRLFPKWLFGYGYADASLYGHSFLYVPALLNLLGFGITTSYKLFLLVLNILTIISSYLCFNRMFNDKKAGVLATYLYMLTPFRLYSMYIGGTIGISSSAVFLPILLLGFYKILTDDVTDKGYKWNWILPTIGFSGVITNHILSTELSVGFALLFCLIFIKRVLVPKRFLELLKAAIMTTLLNLWFAVAFVDSYLGNDLHVKYVNERTIQYRGILPAQLFTLFATKRNGDIYGTQGLNDATNQTTGIVLTFCVLIFLMLCFLKSDLKKSKIGKVGLVFSVSSIVTAWMCTLYFPWDYLQRMNSLFQKLISPLQFPTRILAILGLFMTVVACCLYKMLEKENKGRVFFAMIMATLLIEAMFFETEMLNSSEKLKLYDIAEMGTGYISGSEYIPQAIYGKHEQVLMPRGAECSDNIELLGYSKDDLNVVVSCKNASDAEGYIDIPLLNYKGYKAWDENSGEQIRFTVGERSEIRLLIPAGYEGTIETDFKGMWYWKLADWISGATLIGVVLWIVLSVRKTKKVIDSKNELKESVCDQ